MSDFLTLCLSMAVEDFTTGRWGTVLYFDRPTEVEDCSLIDCEINYQGSKWMVLSNPELGMLEIQNNESKEVIVVWQAATDGLADQAEAA